MLWIKSALLAISTYTRIPTPQIKWEDRAMTLAIAFLPLAGAAVGVSVWLWGELCRYTGMSAVLFASGTVALPLMVTGGIHMDGFCDTSDALASQADSEKCLDIMKDPHIGAFALMRCCLYLLISFGIFYELFTRGLPCGLGFIYTFSRCLAAWSALTLPNARKNGMLAAYTANAGRRAVYAILSLFTALSAAGLIWLAHSGGVAAIAMCLPVTLWYRKTVIKRFGGATGDTAGFYIQITELALAAGLLI